MIKRNRDPLPSGHAGVYRSGDGKSWDAYVADTVKGKPDLILLGTYPTIRAAVAARVQYWRNHKKRRAA
jgi:hypothetical protein